MSFLQGPTSIIRKLLIGSVGSFVYGIFGKWYLIIAIPGIMVVFWVFTGLEKIGVLSAAQTTLINAVHSSKAIAQHCTEKLIRFDDFLTCLNNPPAYNPHQEEKAIEELIQQNSNEGNKGNKSEKQQSKNYDDGDPYN
jgi:hypothetical protein